MKKKKLTTAGMAAVIAAVLLTGCTEDKKAEKKTAATETEQEKKTAATETKQEEETVQKEEETKTTSQYRLKKTGSISDPEQEIKISSGLLTVKGEEDKLLDYQGEEIGSYDAVELFQNTYALVCNSKEKVNSTGLVSLDGEKLIPCEAAFIRMLDSYEEQEKEKRFVEVIYAEDVTTNQEEAFFFSTQRWYAVTPEEQDTLYTGYAKIYDLKEKKFVDNLKITTENTNRIKACGDYIYVKEDDKTCFYDSDGKVVYETANGVQDIKGKYFIEKKGGENVICDGRGTEFYSSKEDLMIIPGDTLYIGQRENGNWKILDEKGEPVAEQTFYNIVRSYCGMFLVSTSDSKYALIGSDGVELMPYGDSVIYFTTNGCAYRSSSKDDTEHYDVIDQNKILHKNISRGKGSQSGLLFTKDNKDGTLKQIYEFKSQDYTLEAFQTNTIGLNPGLISIRMSSGSKFGVEDVLSGSELLGYEYQEIMSAGSYLYAYKDGEWEIYEIICEE